MVLDRVALGRGLVAALAIVVPAAVVGELAEEGSALRSLTLLGVLVGLGFGGASAARTADEGRLQVGAATGAATYLVVQGIGIVLRLGRGESVAWLALPMLTALSATVGMLGAWAAGLRRLPTDEPAPDGAGGPEEVDP